MQNTQSKLSEQERIDLVANRVYAYFLQIIEYKRKMGVKTFVIDHVHRGELDMSLVELENKYDSKSNWREILEIPNGVGAWHTLSSDEVPNFKEMGDNADGKFFIDIEKVLQKVSLLLSKSGIANYPEQPEESADRFPSYFYKNDKFWLHIVLS
jgi:hypothetical protein